MIPNIVNDPLRETVEEFTKRVKVGSRKGSQKTNFFATLNPINRVISTNSQTVKKEKDTLREILEQYGL